MQLLEPKKKQKKTEVLFCICSLIAMVITPFTTPELYNTIKFRNVLHCLGFIMSQDFIQKSYLSKQMVKSRL